MFFHGCCFTLNVCQLQDQDAIAHRCFIGHKTKHLRVIQTLELFVLRELYASLASRRDKSYMMDKQL